jgi:hypothetical protein
MLKPLSFFLGNWVKPPPHFLVSGVPESGRHTLLLFVSFFFFSYFAVTFSLVFSLLSFATRAFQMGFSAAFLSIPSTENKNSTPTLLHFFYKRERRSKNPKWLTPIAARCMTQAPPTSPGKKKTGMCRPEEEEVDDGGGGGW